MPDSRHKASDLDLESDSEAAASDDGSPVKKKQNKRPTPAAPKEPSATAKQLQVRVHPSLAFTGRGERGAGCACAFVTQACCPPTQSSCSCVARFPHYIMLARNGHLPCFKGFSASASPAARGGTSPNVVGASPTFNSAVKPKQVCGKMA